MKYIFLLLLIILSGLAIAQEQDTTFHKQSIKSTQVELYLSYYNQDGNNSAVTGGTGTEKLTVYLNKLVLTQVIDSSNTVTLEGGIDVISSASTDNIDYVVSSASALDNRLWIIAGYQHLAKNKKDILSIFPSFSIESDYTSVGIGGGLASRNEPGNWRYGFSAQFYADDLRWGRLDDDYYRPVTLIYPVELRDSTWFDIYMRYSYNINLDIQHDINKRMSIGFFPGLIYQQGLLSTPYHRFYFRDASKAVVENLPRSRVKVPLGMQLNSFVGARTVIQFYYRFYWDDFGILSHTLSLETPVKVRPQLTATPFFRYYVQRGSEFFYPHQTADPDQAFFTSDYDLSGFRSYSFGIGAQFLTLRRSFFRQINFRYAHYLRSDGLSSNQISSYIGMSTK